MVYSSWFIDWAFWRVSADTRSPTKTFEDKLCGSPLYLPLRGGLCLPYGKHASILTYYQTIVNKKRPKNAKILAALSAPVLSKVEGVERVYHKKELFWSS